MIQTSIIMPHYAEDEEREEIAKKCIMAVQPHRNKTTEFILVFDGICPHRDEYIKYCDAWFERPNDASWGKSCNIGAKMAKGEILSFMCDDNLLSEGAVAECVRLIKKYPQFLVTPLAPHPGRARNVYPLIDGYFGNKRGDDQCTFMTRKVFEDIGPKDEVDPFTDGINYTNRRIAKGYHVMMTKIPLAKDIAPGKHSFKNQMKRLGYRGYKSDVPVYSREELIRLSYRNGRTKIFDALSLSGRPAEIQDCSRDDLPAFFKEMGFKVGAEIGVDKGEFTEKLAMVGLTVYAIDPWLWQSDYDDPRGQGQFDAVYDHAARRLSSYPNCKIIKKISMEAVGDFEDNSLDFVYIDGNHQLKYVVEDIFEWSKKVRPGGVISGHDYVYIRSRSQIGICHVIPAVNAYTQAYKIANWYLLGRKHSSVGEKRDRFRSWMWIKP